MKEKYLYSQDIQNYPQDIAGVPRRQFIRKLLGSAAAAAVMPSFALAKGRESYASLREAAAKIHPGGPGDEKFWEMVKENFMIREGLIMMNAANLCPSPYPVQQFVFKYTRDVDADASFANRGKFNRMKEDSRTALAHYVGADPDEIAITRNTSEGNNIVIGGLVFKPGDEVVIWDENHPTANVAWDVRAERYGFTVKRVKTPERPLDDKKLLKAFTDALSGKTKVIAFSHVSNVSGIAMPAKDLCKICRERDILTLVDGAQTFGAHAVNLHDLGCDFYTGSSHKWFVGPKEVGILYVRKEKIEELWPLMVGVGWRKDEMNNARKFETQGQRDDARVCAMGRTVEFHNTIGRERVEARVRALAAAIKDEVKKKISGAELVTPVEPEMSGGVVIFTVPGMDRSKALNTLYEKYNLGCAVMGGGIRLSPHLYNTMEEVERAMDAAKNMV